MKEDGREAALHGPFPKIRGSRTKAVPAWLYPASPHIRPKTGRMWATGQHGDAMAVDQLKEARRLEIDISVRSVMGPAVYSGLSNAMKLS